MYLELKAGIFTREDFEFTVCGLMEVQCKLYFLQC